MGVADDVEVNEMEGDGELVDVPVCVIVPVSVPDLESVCDGVSVPVCEFDDVRDDVIDGVPLAEIVEEEEIVVVDDGVIDSLTVELCVGVIVDVPEVVGVTGGVPEGVRGALADGDKVAVLLIDGV